MEQPSLQQRFFSHIRNNLPLHISLVDEISELLNISSDSAYRRIRGEKEISFDETRALCLHYKISLDQLFHLNSESLIFSGRMADPEHFPFDLYLSSVVDQLRYMNSFSKRELLYLNKDIPIFHHFHYNELGAFKIFFWMKTLMQYPALGNSLFSAADFSDSLKKTSVAVVEEYNKLPSQEVWNVENIHSTIRQIEYYKQTRVFKTAGDIISLYEALDKTLDHIEKQAELGYKFPLQGQMPQQQTPFKLFVNEFILGDNTLCAILDDNKIVYLNHSVLNYIRTHDAAFAEYTYKHYQNILRRSALISDFGEKERKRFFNTMHEKIENRKRAVESYTPK